MDADNTKIKQEIGNARDRKGKGWKDQGHVDAKKYKWRYKDKKIRGVDSEKKIKGPIFQHPLILCFTLNFLPLLSAPPLDLF